MTNLIKRDGSLMWGEDPHEILKTALETQDFKLAKVAEEKLVSQYLLSIRTIFSINNEIINIIKSKEKALDSKDQIFDILKNKPEFRSESILYRVIEFLLIELEDLKTKDPSLYIVDAKTGRLTFKADEKSFYQPPDYVGEDGKLHKAQLILHPGLSSSYALNLYDNSRKEENKIRIIEKVSANPTLAPAYAHILDPDSMSGIATRILEDNGIEIGEVSGSCTDIEITFGKESLAGSDQSINPRFHRAEMFGKSLSKKILEAYPNIRICELGSVSTFSDTRNKWYSVRVKIQSRHLLGGFKESDSVS